MKILIDLSWLRSETTEIGKQAIEACRSLICGTSGDFVLLLSEDTPEPIPAQENVRIVRIEREDVTAAVRREAADWNLFPVLPAPTDVSGERAVSLLWSLSPDVLPDVSASEWKRFRTATKIWRYATSYRR